MLNIKPFWRKPDGKAKARRKSRYRKGNFAFNCGIRSLSYLGVISVEVLIVGILSQTNHISVDAYGVLVRLAYAEALLSVVFGLLSAMASEQATHAKNDPRPEFQARWKKLLAASFALIVVPVLFLAQALTWPLQVAKHENYVHGTAVKSDRMTSLDPMANPIQQEAANKRLRELELAPSTPGIDLLMLPLAALIYILTAIVPGFLARPPAETPRETVERLRAQTVARAKATREANLQAAHDREMALLAKAAKTNRWLGGPAVKEVKTA